MSGVRQWRHRDEAHYGPERGTTYLLHFDQPYQHARHYTGWTTDLGRRLAEHRRGEGSVLMNAVRAAGIGFTLARTWPNTTRDREDSLKHRGSARKFCPECGVKPAASRLASDTPPERLPLYELERLGTTSDGEPLPVVTTYPHREESTMFRRGARAAARAHQREWEVTEADLLFAEADRLDELAKRSDYRQEITAERAARIRERIGEDLVLDARAPAQMPEPALQGADLDAEVDRLAEMFPEPTPSTGAAEEAGCPDPIQGLPAWDRYVTSQPGSVEHKAAYVDMHRESTCAACFPDPDPDRSYLIEHGYETDANRGALPGSAEVDWPGPEPGPDAARWMPDMALPEQQLEAG